jgi:hypothetical protein
MQALEGECRVGPAGCQKVNVLQILKTKVTQDNNLNGGQASFIELLIEQKNYIRQNK